MSAITTWTFSQTGHGNVATFQYNYGYAGGFAIVGFSTDDSPTSFQIFNLGNSQVAIMAMLTTDSDGTQYPNYWNSNYGTSEDGNNPGMMTWNSTENGTFASNSIGAEQTFVLENGGSGNIALRATGGAFAGQYLCGMQGGWYPDQSSGFGVDLGTGSFISTQRQYLQIQGDQLPILIIASSGYKLDLQNEKLPAMSIAGFNMQECNLAGADLTQIENWAGTDFSNAILDGAKLTGQDLAGATWNAAKFRGPHTDLRGIKGAANCMMFGAVFDGANLAGVNFDNSNLKGASFKGATLDGAHFSGAHLEGAVFDGATLNGTHFDGAHMQATSFSGCDLSTTYFGPAPQFTRAPTLRTMFVNATVPYFVLEQNWSWLDLTGAKITGLPKRIVELVADGALLPDGLDLSGMDLRCASFVGTRMYGINLQKANLEGAVLVKTRLKQAFLQGANLTNANLDSAWLIAEQPSAAVGARSSRRETILTDLEPATLAGAFMFNTVLDAAHCDGVDFTGAYFLTAPSLGARQGASAIGAYMNYANFGNAWLLQTAFDGAQLSAAIFADAHLLGASFQDYDGAATELTMASDVNRTRASVAQADIRGTNFAGANMDGLEMAGATYSTAPGSFSQTFTGYNSQQVPVAFNFGPTLLGNTTSATICPNNSSGPCTLPAGAPATGTRAAATASP